MTSDQWHCVIDRKIRNYTKYLEEGLQLTFIQMRVQNVLKIGIFTRCIHYIFVISRSSQTFNSLKNPKNPQPVKYTRTIINRLAHIDIVNRLE